MGSEGMKGCGGTVVRRAGLQPRRLGGAGSYPALGRARTRSAPARGGDPMQLTLLDHQPLCDTCEFDGGDPWLTGKCVHCLLVDGIKERLYQCRYYRPAESENEAPEQRRMMEVYLESET